MAAGGRWTDAARHRWQTLEIGAKFRRGRAGNSRNLRYGTPSSEAEAPKGMSGGNTVGR